MTTAKYRIPRTAAAVMVLGGSSAACGDGSGSGGVNASLSRAKKVTAAYCRLYAECDPDYFEMYYDDLDDCVASYTENWDLYVSVAGKECMDAQLDEMECVTKLGCDEDESEACDDLAAKSDELCDAIDDQDVYNDDSTSKARSTKPRLRRRIPR